MSTQSNRALINISWPALLTICFVLLKAFDKIDWSWWWVFAPLWAPAAIVLGSLAVAGVVGLFVLFVVAIIAAFAGR